VPSDFDDLFLIIDVPAESRPSARAIATLVSCTSGRPGRRCFPVPPRRVGRLPDHPSAAADYHRGVLLPVTIPDIFLNSARTTRAGATSRWYLSNPADDTLRWPLSVPATKRAQLEATARSAARGEVVYPLTRPALARAAAAVNA
jgi:hypothetical protein